MLFTHMLHQPSSTKDVPCYGALVKHEEGDSKEEVLGSDPCGRGGDKDALYRWESMGDSFLKACGRTASVDLSFCSMLTLTLVPGVLPAGLHTFCLVTCHTGNWRQLSSYHPLTALAVPLGLLDTRKKAFLIALKTGQARHACEQLHIEYKAEAQCAKQRYTRTQAAEFMRRLFQKDPAVHKHLMKPVSSRTTPISEQAWQDYINNLFHHPSASNNDAHGSDNGALGDTGPHPLNLPGEVELTSLVSKHISNMNNSSSPGFDSVLPPFMKHACKLVQRHHGRGLEHHNVLAPHISQLFMLMLKTARIPSSWKAAKLAPIYKKGPVTYPSNYRMLA
eukprot:1154183-Pelagomonas_calceolata.AAC.10